MHRELWKAAEGKRLTGEEGRPPPGCMRPFKIKAIAQEDDYEEESV